MEITPFIKNLLAKYDWYYEHEREFDSYIPRILILIEKEHIVAKSHGYELANISYQCNNEIDYYDIGNLLLLELKKFRTWLENRITYTQYREEDFSIYLETPLRRRIGASLFRRGILWRS